MLHIHIGLHKTGTSTIQQFMSANAKGLEKFDVLYPEIGRANNAHHNLVAEVRPNTAFYRRRKGGWSSLKDLVEANPEKTVVISSEGFHTFSLDAVQAVRAATAGIDVRIICYVRDLAHQWRSGYVERTKTGNNVLDFDEYIKGKRGSSTLKELRRWIKVFGSSALRIRSLDERSLVDRNLLSDFMAAINLDGADVRAELGLNNDLVRNSSPGWKTVELIRQMHEASGGLRAEAESKSDFKLTKARKVSAKIKSIGLMVGAELGFDGVKAQYLTGDQIRRAHARYAKLVNEINAEIEDSSIPLPEALEIEERPFLPCAAEVPLGERAEFHEHVLFELLRQFAAEGAETPTKRGVRQAGEAACSAADDDGIPTGIMPSSIDPDQPQADGAGRGKNKGRRRSRQRPRQDTKGI